MFILYPCAKSRKILLSHAWSDIMLPAMNTTDIYGGRGVDFPWDGRRIHCLGACLIADGKISKLLCEVLCDNKFCAQ